jgi:hypothetical protein
MQKDRSTVTTTEPAIMAPAMGVAMSEQGSQIYRSYWMVWSGLHVLSLQDSHPQINDATAAWEQMRESKSVRTKRFPAILKLGRGYKYKWTA